MAVAVDNSYVGQLAATVLRPAVSRPALSDYFTVREGIKGKQVVTFLERAELVTIVDPGCGTGISTLNLGTSQATWDPVDMKAWISECWKGLRGKVWEHGLKSGNDKKDLSDTEYGDYMVDVLEDAVGADLLRMAWFGDTSLTTASFPTSLTLNGSTYTATQLLTFFKTFNGIWKRIYQAQVAGTLGGYISLSTNNAVGGAQTFASTEVLALFQGMFNAAPAKLTSQPLANWQFQVTRSIFTAWQTLRETQNLDLSYQAQADGILRPTFRGVPIMVVDEWDQRISTFFRPSATPTKKDLPHRAILTVKGNFQIGFDAMPINDNGRADLEVFTDQMSETWNARATYLADTQIADPGLIVAAY